MGPTHIHWLYQWENNFEGVVRPRTPDGKEVARWEAGGTKITGGHLSNGTKPLDRGSWELRLEGQGWFELHLERYSLADDVWSRYGVDKPAA